jgi:hypothetical protein
MRFLGSRLRSMSGRKRTALFVLAAGLALLVYLVLNIPDVDLVLRFSDRLAVLPTAKAEYRQILDKIASATHDDLLRDETSDEPRIYRGSHGCIAAQGNRTYGTNRPHADIQKDYAKAFAPLVWELGETGAGFKVIGAGTKTTGVQIVFIDPVSPDFSVGKGKYQTIYRVQLVYADPQIFGCFY